MKKILFVLLLFLNLCLFSQTQTFDSYKFTNSVYKYGVWVEQDNKPSYSEITLDFDTKTLKIYDINGIKNFILLGNEDKGEYHNFYLLFDGKNYVLSIYSHLQYLVLKEEYDFKTITTYYL